MHGVLPDQWLTCFSRYIEIRAKAGGLASGGFLISADLAPRPWAKPCSAHLRHLRPAKTLEVHDLRGGPRLPRGGNLARVALGSRADPPVTHGCSARTAVALCGLYPGMVEAVRRVLRLWKRLTRPSVRGSAGGVSERYRLYYCKALGIDAAVSGTILALA